MDDPDRDAVPPGPVPDGPSLRELVTLGGTLVGCIVAGLVVGLSLDAWLGTSPAFVLGGTAFGIVAAGAGFWAQARDYLRG